MKIALVLLLAAAAGTALALLLRRDGRVAPPPDVTSAASTRNARSAAAPLLAPLHLTERDTGFFGRWGETRIGGTRVAFVDGNSMIDVIAGDFDADAEQITDVYMMHVGPGLSLPDDPGQRLDRFVGDEGAELARRYFLAATGAPDHPELRNEAIREALIGLSDAVSEVGIFETEGVRLSLDTGDSTPRSLASDVRHAVAIASALREARAVAAGR